ncbi:hypothetical protein ACFS07_08820 [Undibacterium arcticum]
MFNSAKTVDAQRGLRVRQAEGIGNIAQHHRILAAQFDLFHAVGQRRVRRCLFG